jgi:hypothetical protein
MEAVMEAVMERVPPPYDIGDAATIEWLPVTRLYVDHRYQRPLALYRSRDIAAAFNPAAVGLLFVNRRADGTLAVYDGQTRLEALRLRGAQVVLCRVVSGLSETEEAQAFVDCNRIRGSVAAIYLYRAQLAFGDPTACAIQALLDARGLMVSEYRTRDIPRPVISAVGALDYILRSQGEAILAQTLDTLQMAWPGYEQDIYTRDILRATASVLNLKGRQITVEALAALLGTLGPEQLRDRGHVLAQGTHWSPITSVVNAIIEAWNRAHKTDAPVPYLGTA